MIKRVEVFYQGKKHKVGIDDDVAFGKLSSLINTLIDMEALVQGQVKVDIHSFILGMMPVIVVEAPWDLNNPDWMENIGYKTAKDLISHCAKIYPLGDYLADIMGTLMGSRE